MAALAIGAFMSFGIDDEHLQRVRLWRIRRTPARNVGDGAWVKVVGRIEAAVTKDAPLSGEPCVWHLSTAVVPGDEIIDRGGVDFWLRDDSGRVRVSINNVYVSRIDEVQWRAGVLAEPLPLMRRFLEAHAVSWERSQAALHYPIFCSETLLVDGQELIAYGRARWEPDPDEHAGTHYRDAAGRIVLEGTPEAPLLLSPGRRGG